MATVTSVTKRDFVTRCSVTSVTPPFKGCHVCHACGTTRNRNYRSTSAVVRNANLHKAFSKPATNPVTQPEENQWTQPTSTNCGKR